MKAKEVISALNQWAKDTHRPVIDYRKLHSKEWGFAKRIGNLFDSRLQFMSITYGVSRAGGFKFGYLSPYSYTIYKKEIEKIGDLSYEKVTGK